MDVIDDLIIDNDILIEEVESLPALYDKSLKVYSDTNVKRKLWQQVCSKVFFNTWGDLNNEEKEKAGR